MSQLSMRAGRMLCADGSLVAKCRQPEKGNTMAKQKTKPHKRVAKRKPALRHDKRVRVRKAARPTKSVAQKKKISEATLVERRILEPDVIEEMEEGLGPESEPTGDIFEVVEIEVVGVPEDGFALEDDE
jgi:hypothetical protein